ncbi:FtsX-like permease family protein [Emticicia sp. BO119]|uniref:FtsX-like permease family protein n=1 Tax=Emticicia sp. BO119 TaxID=2757768 RepID=UPI0015F00C85|nr:FtsX-like permease family protein [Emticicia sp. BO119]MBA4849928.1 ABC transporter permease [Emticicia sp. BO119]
MNLSFLIARRYFLSRKKKSFINFISFMSMLGIGIGTMATVAVLSVFNGLEDLNRSIFKSFDPDIKISAVKGKTFNIEKDKLVKLKKIEGVDYITEVIQDNALVMYEDGKMVVTLKGVDSTFQKNSRLKGSLVEGSFVLNKDSIDYAFIGGNVYGALNISIDNILEPLEIWYPKNQKKLSLIPENNINKKVINISGVYALEQFHDDFVYVPLSVAKELTEYNDKRTSLEVQLKPMADADKIQGEIKVIFGDMFLVQNQDQQNANLFRAIKIEKLFIFIALVFIIGVASFNIFFSLTMLVIDKKDEVRTLYAMGADDSLIRRIFFSEGAIISFIGTIVGLILGFVFCLTQERYGWLGMGMDSAVVDAYPVKINPMDFLITAVAVVIITLLVSYFPARRASSEY